MSTYVHSHIHDSQKWKQPKYSPVSSRINKVSYICAIKCYSAVKRDEVATHATACMDLKRHYAT